MESGSLWDFYWLSYIWDQNNKRYFVPHGCVELWSFVAKWGAVPASDEMKTSRLSASPRRACNDNYCHSSGKLTAQAGIKAFKAGEWASERAPSSDKLCTACLYFKILLGRCSPPGCGHALDFTALRLMFLPPYSCKVKDTNSTYKLLTLRF